MGNGKKFTASFIEKETFSGKDFEAPFIGTMERKIRFSFKHCDTGRKHCIATVASDKNVLADLYKRLGYFEDITWGTMQSLSREQGVSIEKRDSGNYKEMSGIYNGFDTFGHFRVSSKSKSKFRVFGAISEDLFYILRFDIDGKMNHS